MFAPAVPVVAADAAAKQDAPPEVLPPSDPAALRAISAEDALAVNAGIPISTAPNPAAAPFAPKQDVANWARSIDCLTAAVYYEAASESTDGERAVAQVVLNRVRHPAYPHSVCGVVFQGAAKSTGCQFSFTCDGSLARTPSQAGWARARSVAQAALAGYVYTPVGWATHYHADYVVPYWASTLLKVGSVGAHIFYRWNGGWGQGSAFSARYAGAEPALNWRAGFGTTEAQTALASAAPPEPDMAMPTVADRPLLVTSPPVTAPTGAAPKRAYVTAERRWMLGGVPEEPKPAEAAETAGTK
jgi:spore germination cell wall hydrolase CwlJ-like protein